MQSIKVDVAATDDNSDEEPQGAAAEQRKCRAPAHRDVLCAASGGASRSPAASTHHARTVPRHPPGLPCPHEQVPASSHPGSYGGSLCFLAQVRSIDLLIGCPC